jgi:hypothetical protein
MLKPRKRGRRLAGTMLLAVLFAVAAYAFTASNTVPATKAGDGSGNITGYTVSGITYTLRAADPSYIDKWSFTLDSAATQVQSKLVAASASYTTCTIVGGTAVTCDPAPAAEPTVVSVDGLRVIATS